MLACFPLASPAHGPPENTRGSAEVERASGGVGVHALAQEALILHLLANEPSRDGDLLSASNHLHSARNN